MLSLRMDLALLPSASSHCGVQPLPTTKLDDATSAAPSPEATVAEAGKRLRLTGEPSPVAAAPPFFVVPSRAPLLAYSNTKSSIAGACHSRHVGRPGHPYDSPLTT